MRAYYGEYQEWRAHRVRNWRKPFGPIVNTSPHWWRAGGVQVQNVPRLHPWQQWAIDAAVLAMPRHVCKWPRWPT